MDGPIAIRYFTNYGADKVKHLLLMGASTPRFTQADDFEFGLKPEEVDDIIKNLQEDCPAFIKEFSGMFFRFPKWMHEKLPYSKLVTFAESGHGMNVDEKENFNTHLLDVLSK